MDDEFAHLQKLKARLVHTWEPLLARFGRFTEIQVLAIEPLLAGKNCLLVSSTSSGKTEAALVPILERHIEQQKQCRGKLSILYICPTKALSRDLAFRLQPAMQKLAVKMQIKTGDEPTINLRNLPELLITTLESFDSLLVNKPSITKDIHTVILDEIHLYDNTARGDQLCILLNRLRKIKNFAISAGDISNSQIQFCAMSATVNQPEVMAARYFNDPLVITSTGQRNFNAELLELQDRQSLATFLTSLKQKNCRKVLCFCQKRVECEQWAQWTIQNNSPFGQQVFVHHASLDKKARHTVEESFSKAFVAICYATSTLELGIDIGDLDLVVLIGPPDSTASFLQRIGRSNRRKTEITTVCFYRDEIEEALFKVFIKRAKEGVVDYSPYFFRPSVIIQQLCSYIKQTRLGEFNANQAYSLFATPKGEPLIDKALYDEIIVHLIDKNYFLVSETGNLRPSKVWHDLYEERAIYSNISNNQLVDLIDDATGRKLGQVQKGLKEGDTILFSGQKRKVVRKVFGKIVVQTQESIEKTSVFYHHSPYQALSCDIAKAVANELQLVTDKINNFLQIYPSPNQENQYLIVHALGEAYSLILKDLLETDYNLIVEDCDWLSLTLIGTFPSTFNIQASQVKNFIYKRWKQLESLFEFGSYQTQLPTKVRQSSIVSAFNIDKFIENTRA